MESTNFNWLRMPVRYLAFAAVLFFTGFVSKSPAKLLLLEGTHISLIGNNLCSRMMNYGLFETELHLRHPEKNLIIRNMCDGGDTPGFRPHSGRNTPWAFPGAENFQTELGIKSNPKGHFEYPDEWLTRLKTDVIIACFGFNESYNGEDGVENYKSELSAFIQHTLSQKYNDKSTPQLALVSPIAFQDLSAKYDLPNGKTENQNLQLYADAMREVAARHNVLFVDAFSPSSKWFSNNQALTIDGLQLNGAGYELFSSLLVDEVFGKSKTTAKASKEKVKAAVLEKNWFWHNDYKVPNGVHVFGRRYNPFGSNNYPLEIIKNRQMTVNRDLSIWATAQGKKYDLVAADAKTVELKKIETNFELGEGIPYRYGEDVMSKFTMAPGFKVELFASEEDFPELANPSQIAFDNKGRLWVAVMPTYPHYKPGDAKPNDKLIILEDTNGDNKADKLTVFVDELHIPAGFEFAPEGVYISQGTNLKLYTDTDGDDKADKMEVILSGFDDHDTHHVISAFCADPSGAIYMGEGVFLHTNVETPYGPVRATNGGFMRYNPQRKHLERTAQVPIPNPWGIAFDEWGQNFFAATSGPDVYWMMPGTVKSIYGISHPNSANLIEEKHKVRPTSGLEFVHSRHFPDEIQGDMLINNTIGFLGMKVHQMIDDGTGYETKHRMDLITSTDPNFRPVDMEFAPDGSLYLADWHNVLIGHMQHNARDPLRDHVHGKIYRITYPSRPLVRPAKVAGASIAELLDNLKLPEYRTRYRTRRELRERNPSNVLATMKAWTANLDKSDKNYQHHLLEGLWVSWGLNKIDEDLLNKLLKSPDYRVRAATVKVVRYNGHRIKNQTELLAKAANDPHGRVRMEAMVAGSWLDKNDKETVIESFEKSEIDEWMKKQYDFVKKPISEYLITSPKKVVSEAERLLTMGKEIYSRDGYCSTCHQPNGAGLESSGFPPLTSSPWVVGDRERLVKIMLNGLYGPIEVNGKKYPGNVPMTPYGGMLNDEEIAAVGNYVRNAFGNTTSEHLTPDLVKKVRNATKDKQGFYTPDELLKQHPNK
jgi:mono/diheme cytochrome c family protein/glucose/arabinose dehydrogenase